MRRLLALVILIAALGGLVWQFQINGTKPGLSCVGIRLWLMARYFTNFSALLVAGHMLATLFGRERGSAMVTLSSVAVGVIYWQILQEEMPVPHLSPDFLLHRLVPGLTLLWWVLFGDRGLRFGEVPRLLLPPLVYLPYALVRGAVTGIWPYAFLDLPRLGLVEVGKNVAGLMLVFLLGGLAMWAVAAVMRRVGL